MNSPGGLNQNILNKDYYKKVIKKIWSYCYQPPTKLTRICVELTNRCNLNCPYCLVGQQNTQNSVAHNELVRQRGVMSMELCKKIIREAQQFGIKEIMLTFQGEPLLFKRKSFIELISLSKKNGLKAMLFTNGLLLDPVFSRAILRAGLDVIRFSVDGTTQEIYALNRVGGNFEKVFQNMKDMVRIAKEVNSRIEMYWQFIALKNNEHQIVSAQKMAEQIGIQFILKTFAESIPELMPENPRYQRKLSPKPCKDIYRAVWVYWNGDVVPCCYDLEGKEIVGNIKENSLGEIWNGEKYKNLRKRINEVLLHPDNEPELCKGCLKYTAPESLRIKTQSPPSQERVIFNNPL